MLQTSACSTVLVALKFTPSTGQWKIYIRHYRDMNQVIHLQVHHIFIFLKSSTLI